MLLVSFGFVVRLAVIFNFKIAVDIKSPTNRSSFFEIIYNLCGLIFHDVSSALLIYTISSKNFQKYPYDFT